MFVYQNNKLYVLKNDKVIGVEIHPDKTLLVEGTETEIMEGAKFLTGMEVRCKFHLDGTNSYIFPIDKPEVIGVEENEPISNIKKSNRKSKCK